MVRLKPSPEDIQGLEAVIFDIQDVGGVSILVFRPFIMLWKPVPKAM